MSSVLLLTDSLITGGWVTGDCWLSHLHGKLSSLPRLCLYKLVSAALWQRRHDPVLVTGRRRGRSGEERGRGEVWAASYVISLPTWDAHCFNLILRWWASWGVPNVAHLLIKCSDMRGENLSFVPADARKKRILAVRVVLLLTTRQTQRRGRDEAASVVWLHWKREMNYSTAWPITQSSVADQNE